MFGLGTKKPDIKLEAKRRKSQRTKILELLKSGRPVYTYDLQRIAFNYTMRISELRKDGYIINSMYEKPGVFKYFLKGRRSDEHMEMED